MWKGGRCAKEKPCEHFIFVLGRVTGGKPLPNVNILDGKKSLMHPHRQRLSIAYSGDEADENNNAQQH